eukprot:15446669-Alexandrium_andersonii.AAC.1
MASASQTHPSSDHGKLLVAGLVAAFRGDSSRPDHGSPRGRAPDSFEAWGVTRSSWTSSKAIVDANLV